MRYISTISIFLMLLFSLSFFGQCPTGNIEVKIVLTTDGYSSETSWQLADKFGTVLLFNDTLSNNATFMDSICVPVTSCYHFLINDSFGDGICCTYGSGNFQIYVNDVLQLNHNGIFAHTYTYSFNCAPGESCQTALSITTGTYTAPGSEYFYSFKPTQVGLYEITNCGLTNTCDTKIWVYENCNSPITSNNTGTILYNDDFCALLSEVSGSLDTSKTYIVRIGSYNNTCNTSIDFAINYLGPISGCTVSTACNYNPLATIDDGSCLYAPNPLCPAPDLTIVQPQFISSLALDTVIANTGDCRVSESCLNGYGNRIVIKFDTYIKNVGDLDYYIGSPSANPGQFTTANCHGHAHYEGYAEYRLYKPNGTAIPIGFKNGFCVLDFDGCPDGGTAKFSCGNMGISNQCGDIYYSGLDCQWIDITDVDTGNYVMAAKVNWDQSADALGHYEKSYVNNWAQACIKITKSAGGDLGFTLLSSCPSYSDCAGVQFGNTAVDCNGVCNGTAKMGDLNSSGTQQLIDGQLYVSGILNTSITPNNCNDLNNSGTLTVWDAALMAECALHGSGINTKCLFPRGNVNPNYTATLSIGNIDYSQNYFDVYITNPTTRVLGYEFNITGANILNVVNLVPAIMYPETPQFLIGGTKVICLSYHDSVIAKNVTAQPLCRVYFNNAQPSVCISSIVEIVNKEYESIGKALASNCFVTTGVVNLNPEHYFSVFPNPASETIELSGFIKQGGLTQLEIRDVAGRILLSQQLTLEESFHYPLSIVDYKPGVYYISLRTSSGLSVKPVVIAR